VLTAWTCLLTKSTQKRKCCVPAALGWQATAERGWPTFQIGTFYSGGAPENCPRIAVRAVLGRERESPQ